MRDSRLIVTSYYLSFVLPVSSQGDLQVHAGAQWLSDARRALAINNIGLGAAETSLNAGYN
jgi:hypothetical protein